MRRILITNDDGIRADGIKRLAECACEFGEVYVIAPKNQCSAMSHRISIREPIDVYEAEFPVKGVKAYAVDGTPADCVRMGILNIMESRTDVVLSGINNGFNCGGDVQYSATVGAALEAASKGITAIAFSEEMSDSHEVTDKYLKEILEELIDKNPGINRIWNVNFSKGGMKSYKGKLYDRKVSLSSFFDDRYDEEPLPDGGIRMQLNGIYREKAEEGTDLRAVIDGFISIGIINNLS